MAFGKRNQDQDIPLDEIEDDEDGVTLARWVPAAVVFVAFSGFIALGWYAYHTGTQSVNEEDLPVVEAEKTPMKEKPLDPGGMKFMNQDKTIYDTFSSNQANPPKVEHVMPTPEEPMAKPEETAETKTWINDKLHQAEEAKNTEDLLAAEKQKIAAGQQTVKPVDTARKAEVMDSGITTHVADEVKQPAAKAVEIKAAESASAVEPVKKVAEKPPVERKITQEKPKNTAALPAIKKPEPANAKAVASTGAAKIQLGAYGSEDEAKAAWGRMQKKFPELGDKTVYVVKADLGAKGVYYRLRAGGVGDASAAKALCAKLSAKGQACLVP